MQYENSNISSLKESKEKIIIKGWKVKTSNIVRYNETFPHLVTGVFNSINSNFRDCFARFFITICSEYKLKRF
jgi:hypothetical protein